MHTSTKLQSISLETVVLPDTEITLWLPFPTRTPKDTYPSLLSLTTILRTWATRKALTTLTSTRVMLAAMGLATAAEWLTARPVHVHVDDLRHVSHDSTLPDYLHRQDTHNLKTAVCELCFFCLTTSAN